MAEQKCFTITWVIENFSICAGADIMESPSWHMPDVGSELFYLKANCSVFGVTFVLGNASRVPYPNHNMYLLSSGGTIPLKPDIFGGFSINRYDIFGDKKHLVLPSDTLTVCCKILAACINIRELRFCSVLYRMNFTWTIENFILRDGTSYKTSCKKDNFLFHIDFIVGGFRKRRNPYRNRVTVCLEPSKGVFEFHLLDFKFSMDRSSLFSVDKLHYHPNHKTQREAEFRISALCNSGNLPLQFECIVSVNKDNTTTTSSSNSMKTSTAYPTSESVNTQTVCPTSESVKTKTVCPTSESVKTNSPTVAVQDSTGTLTSDLLSLLMDTTLSDATLNTEGKSFSAHKIILAARSSVFKAMFEKEDTTEGRSGVVDIEDIDSETVQRLLVFLYGESLGDLQWNDASKLYYAADKYAVPLLKKKCSNILKAGLSVSNACDTIVLADRHSDDELLRGAVDYVRDHQEVMSSSDWEKLEESNSRLAAKILRQVFIKKGKN